MAKLNLKTAEERAAEIRAQSAEIEAAQEKAAAEKQAEIDAKPAEKVVEQVNYRALADAEEARAAVLKAQADALQLELDPTLRPRLAKETEPYVRLDDIMNHPERSAQETLEALHAAIRKGREQAKPQGDVVWPSDLSHLTPSQRERTLREMEAGKARSEAAAASQAHARQMRAAHEARTQVQVEELEKIKERLAEAERTIAVLRSTPVTQADFDRTLIAANKVTSQAL